MLGAPHAIVLGSAMQIEESSKVKKVMYLGVAAECALTSIIYQYAFPRICTRFKIMDYDVAVG